MSDQFDTKVMQALEMVRGFNDQQRRRFYGELMRSSNGSRTAESLIEEEGNTQHNARAWTVADLLVTDFTPARCAVPGILQEGLNILGGRPKTGKSWLALQTSYSIGCGGKFLGIQVEKGNVLYLALEDNPRRLKKRVHDMQIPAIDTIQFHTEWRSFQEGGLDDLMIQIESKDYRLIVIDTLSRAILGVDQNDPTVIGPIMANLQSLGQWHNLAILVIDHIRKPIGVAGDPIDDIMASTSKTAIADTILALYKEQGKPGAILTGRGRDIDDLNLKLRFDRETCCWQSDGDAGQIALTERRVEILNALDDLHTAQLQQIATMIGQPKSNTYNRLQDLYNAGLVKRYAVGNNVYYERVDN